MDVTEAELQGLYTWVDDIPLSRPKRNIARDFSDGVLMAEVVHHFFPKLVELHNYSSANGLQQKLYNWNTLNTKVFKRLGFAVTKPDVEACCNCKAGAVERVLKLMKVKISKYKEEQGDSAMSQQTVMASVDQSQMYGQQQQQQQYMGMGPAMGMGGMPMQRSVPPQAAPMGVMPPSGPLPGMPLGPLAAKMNAAMAPEVIAEKDGVIAELRETNQILETKVRKLEQLVRLKDAKIQTLMAKLQAAGMA